MLLALLLLILVGCVGFGTLRLAGVAKGPLGLGLAPAVGLAVLGVVATWCGFLRLPPPLPGLVLLAVLLAGAAATVQAGGALGGALWSVGRQQRPALAFLALAMGVPCLTLATAFAGVQAPLSTHDGAFHVETIQAMRSGFGWAGWYPPGLAALFGATLQDLPWVDTAAGAFQLSLGLSLVAPLLVFGLGLATWHDPLVAALAALMAAVTYLYGYFVHIWSGWPQQIGLLLLVGLWTCALAYLDRPSPRWAAVAGLLVGSIILTHGTELFSAVIILLALLVARWRRMDWRRLPLTLGVLVLVALVCAGPYLPNVLAFARGGGASVAGLEDAGALDQVTRTSTALGNLGAFGVEALGMDAPLRIILLGAGAWWVMRRGVGRSTLAIGGMFFGLALLFGFGNDSPLVRQVYAVTYPWGLMYRLLMVCSVAAALLGAAGGVALTRHLRGRVGARLARAGRVGLGFWVVLSTWALAVFVAIPVPSVSSFGPDDGRAMDWLRQHAEPGALVANDGFADAGIWVPAKTGLRIVASRTVSSGSDGALVLDNIARLDQVPQAQAAACALGVRYVYRGGQNTRWQARQFPPLEALRASAALHEVFTSGETAIFQARLVCPG